MSAGFEGTLALQIVAGIGLAAATGLRAFLPPLVIGILARLDVVPLRPGTAWLESTPALVIFGVAVVLEILGDKIPWVDHALDVAAIVVKPTAATLVVVATVTDMSPLSATILGLLVGGTVAGTVHIARAGLRLVSTGTTGGLANPVLSVVEDGLSLVTTLVALFAPLLVILIGVVLFLLFRTGRRRRAAPPRHRVPI